MRFRTESEFFLHLLQSSNYVVMHKIFKKWRLSCIYFVSFSCYDILTSNNDSDTLYLTWCPFLFSILWYVSFVVERNQPTNAEKEESSASVAVAQFVSLSQLQRSFISRSLGKEIWQQGNVIMHATCDRPVRSTRTRLKVVINTLQLLFLLVKSEYPPPSVFVRNQ